MSDFSFLKIQKHFDAEGVLARIAWWPFLTVLHARTGHFWTRDMKRRRVGWFRWFL
jgi:hypothetical protein